jgi:hypothetical protein
VYLDELVNNFDKFDFLFYKVLSQNDRSWSWPKNQKGYAHQGGILIPDKFAGKIFPRKEIENHEGKHFIPDRYYRIHTYWLDEDGKWSEVYTGGDWRRQSKFGRSYKDRIEMRITGGMPRHLFSDLNPGSLFVIARCRGSRYAKDYHYYCIVIDSDDPDYKKFLKRFVILDPPLSDIIDLRDFQPEPFATAPEIASDLMNQPLLELLEHRESGYKLPTVDELIRKTIREYESKVGQDLIAYLAETRYPGNTFREIMDLGFNILKEEQKKVYPQRLFNILGAALLNKQLTRELLMGILSENLENVREVFKSLNASVYSRAGNAFERYIRMWLKAFSIPFEKGKVDGERIPDFILPTIEYYMNIEQRGLDDAMLLSAKTTCRERYTEILSEGNHVHTRYLATLDNAVPAKSIKKMEGYRIVMIVTEKDKAALEQYRGSGNVLDYRIFMKSILIPKRRFWDS